MTSWDIEIRQNYLRNKNLLVYITFGSTQADIVVNNAELLDIWRMQGQFYIWGYTFS